jgi:LytR_cpsA_psr family
VEAEPAAPPAKRRRVLPIVLASVAAPLVAVLAVAAIFITQVERSLTQNLDRQDLMPTDSISAAHPTKEEVAADALNFVVMGYDGRDASVNSTGSLMILHLNAKREQAYFISFPGDMWVSIPGHGNNKLNAAYGFGGHSSTALSLRLTDKDVQLIKAPVSGKTTKNGQRVDVVDQAKLAELRTALREDRVNEYLTKYPQG